MHTPRTIDQDTNTVELAHLLFCMFIYVTDTDKEITPYEVQRFNRLLDDPTWTNNKELRRALERLRQDYSSLWGAYETKALDTDLAAISAQLESTWFARTSNIGELRRSLRDFVQKIGQTGSPALARLGMVGTAVSKTNARTRIERLLTTRDEVPKTDAAASAAEAVAPNAPADRASAADWPAAHLELSDEHVWRGGRICVRCVSVTAETADVKTYSFTAVPPRLFHYRPGQFLTIEASIDGRTVRRNYTISSSPSRPHLLSITVKRVPEGLVSNWLYDTMVEGVECFVSGPAGDFSCLNHPSEKLLMISGGSGVTPMMSMLRWMSDTLSPVDIVFINNVRTPSDVIFERELQLISTRLHSRLRLAVVPGLLASGQAWNGLTGPLNDHMLQTFAPDLLEREVFVCGPTGYMEMIRNMLEQLGFPMERFHQEAFGLAQAPPAGALVAATSRVSPTPSLSPVASPPPRARTASAVTAPIAKAGIALKSKALATVVLEKSDKTFTCAPDESILDAADRHNVRLQSLCRIGMCGTCKVRKSKGVVTMNEQRFLTAADIDEGFVLPCISHASGPVALEA